MKNRVLALLMVLALLIGCVPTGVLAEGTEQVEQEVVPQAETQEQTTEAVAEVTEETPEAHSHGASTPHDCEHCDVENVEWTAWGDDAAELTSVPTATGHYYLVADLTVSTQFKVQGTADVVVCLNGWNIDGSASCNIFRVQDTAKLTVCDCTSHTDAEGNLVAGSVRNGKHKDVAGAFYAMNSAVLNVYNIKITGNQNTQAASNIGWSGGAVHARNSAKVLLKNVELSNNKTSADGGAICLRNSAQLTLENCLFKDNEAAGRGGAIYMATNTTKLTATGCTFESNEAGVNGGAVCTIASATGIALTDCVFSQNKAANRGGAVYVDDSTITITGGEMIDNEAVGGGALHCYKGNTTVKNVTMTGNIATNVGGSAIYVNGGSAKLKLVDCTITGNQSTGSKTANRGGVYLTNNSDKLTVSGTTVIDDNMIGVVDGVGTKEVNILLQNSGASMNVDGLEEGTKLSVLTYAGAVDTPNFLVDTTDPATWNKTWVTYENNGLAVDYDKQKDEFFFTSTSNHIHCACGEHLKTDESCEHAENPGCDHSEIVYEPWERTDSLPKDPGNYYLTGDVVITKATPVSTNGGVPDIINLCLNGYTVTVDYETQGKAEDSVFYITLTADLTISDCTAHLDEEGNYVAGTLTGGSRSVITLGDTGGKQPNAKLSFYDGILTGNSSTHEGGAIFMDEGNSTFNMYGGLITGNTATGNGGAVYVGKGNTFNMYGGEICDNTTSGNGGVYIHADAAAVSIEGDAVIADNLSGSVASNLYLADDVTVTVGAMGEQANVGISGDMSKLPRQVSANQASLNGLTSDSQYRPLELIDGIVYLSYTKDHVHCDCGGKDVGCEHTENIWVAWDNAGSLPTGTGYYYLVTDVELSATIAHKTGDLHLCLNGHTVTAAGAEGTKNDRIYSVSGDAKLTISDCTALSAKDGTYTAGKLTGSTFSAIFVPNQTGKNEDGTEIVNTCTINLYDGILCGNTADVGGAMTIQDGAVFNMYGGQISGNEVKAVTDADGKTSGGNGAALYVGTNGVFNMYGGTICENTAETSGAVYVSHAIFNMNGGTIRKNTTAGTGAGILLTGASTVMTMEGGQISDHEIESAAGAILLQNRATLNIKGGKITGNKASHGAGVYVSYTATMTMEGGEISGNEAKSGAGLYLLGSTATLTGGKISGNRAKSSAGGIYATNFVRKATETREEQTYTAELNLAGVTVSGNTATGNGGGICVNKGTVVNMTAGTISGNSATGAAGGILLQSKSVLNLKGGSVSNNSAKNGGGVYVSTNTSINMTGGSVSYNTATGSCGGMYLLRCNANLAGGSINNNSTKVNGGGMYIAGANLKLSGTRICDNTAEGNGGGIGTTQAKDGAARYYTTITMTGGVISGNSAVNGGGVLTQTKTEFTMIDGLIENNKTTRGGAGIYSSTDCIFNMEGGTIRNNLAEGTGAGVYHYRSTATYTGGLITGNKAVGAGGGVMVNSTNCVVTIKDLTITENTAKNGGGMVVQGRGTVNIEGGTFTKNISENNGGFIYVSTNSFANITGGTISENKTAKRGGGLYLEVTSTNTMQNAVITNNSAEEGGGIFTRSNLTLSDTKITGNTAETAGGGLYAFKMGYRMLMQPEGLKAKNLTVEGNTAGTEGGGLYLGVGHIVDLSSSTITGNTAGAEGGGIWAIYDTDLRDLTITGNTAATEGGGLYLAACEYDGESYVKGVFKIAGVIQVKDNQGGDMYIGEQTTVTVAKDGLAENSLINVKLHSGLLTQTVYGAYNYEGGNLEYVITAGERSLTNPEYDPTWNDQFNPEEPTQAPTEGEPVDRTEQEGTNPIVWVIAAAGAVVVAAVIAILAVLGKKKKAVAGK